MTTKLRSSPSGKDFVIPPSAPSPHIVWRPGGGGDAETWLEVMALVAANAGPSTIILSEFTTCNITPPGTYDLKGSSFLGTNVGNFSSIDVQIADATVLLDCAGIDGGVSLFGASTVAGGWLQFSPNIQSFYVRGFSTLQNSLGVSPAILASASFILYVSDNAYLAGTNVVVASGGSVYVVLTDFGSGNITDDYVTSTTAQRVIYVHDGSLPTPLPTSAGCTIVNSPLGTVGGSGATAFRPVSKGVGEFGTAVGCEFFDTTLGIPVYWNGGGYVNSAGAPA